MKLLQRIRTSPGTALAIILLMCLFAGCVSVPTSEFNSYLNSFNSAKSTAQDFILQAKVAAETVANSPDNPARPNERVEKLNERRVALDTRLAALDLISEYNNILVALAEGSDPKAIEGQIEGFRDALSSFGFSKLASLGSKASPYTAAIAEAVRLIDDQIKKQKFKQAVEAGQKPIIGVLEILQEDADNIHEIEAQLIQLKRDLEETQLRKTQIRLKNLVATYQSSPDLDQIISRYEETLATLTDSPLAQNKINNPAGAAMATAADLAILQSLLDNISHSILGFNRLTDAIKAHQKVTEEYKLSLASTASALQNLNAGIKMNQRAALVGFAEQALHLREALLKYQNTKSI
jgi:hypothetical protein